MEAGRDLKRERPLVEARSNSAPFMNIGTMFGAVSVDVAEVHLFRRIGVYLNLNRVSILRL